MKRKPGVLTMLERQILDAIGGGELHGYAIAVRVRDMKGGGLLKLPAHGTLYRALGRLEEAGQLVSSWEPARDAEREKRPRRRLYRRARRAEGE